jgi:hypothetical protein
MPVASTSPDEPIAMDHRRLTQAQREAEPDPETEGDQGSNMRVSIGLELQKAWRSRG